MNKSRQHGVPVSWPMPIVPGQRRPSQITISWPMPRVPRPAVAKSPSKSLRPAPAVAKVATKTTEKQRSQPVIVVDCDCASTDSEVQEGWAPAASSTTIVAEIHPSGESRISPSGERRPSLDTSKSSKMCRVTSARGPGFSVGSPPRPGRARAFGAACSRTGAKTKYADRPFVGTSRSAETGNRFAQPKRPVFDRS